jgi:hypothetical protein
MLSIISIPSHFTALPNMPLNAEAVAPSPAFAASNLLPNAIGANTQLLALNNNVRGDRATQAADETAAPEEIAVNEGGEPWRLHLAHGF